MTTSSGDTGGAVAHGFYDVEGVEVVILYPSGKVSSVQEKQLTTLGKNIHALEVNGSFDNCQQLVKQAFADTGTESKLFLTSANSINVARWLPQQFYYLFAWKQWPHKTATGDLGAERKFRKYMCRFAGALFRLAGQAFYCSLQCQRYCAAIFSNRKISNQKTGGHFIQCDGCG